MKTTSVTRLHQALYGYQNGHQLIASSHGLSAKSRTTLLVLTDMSGPSMVPGFENYLTGVPLTAEQLYAFSRTWYAPEMPRLGCVWTHTILIRFADLVQIPDLGGLIGIFRRPGGNENDRETFTEPVVFDSNSYENASWFNASSVTKLAAAFYSGDRPLALSAPTASEWEHSILQLWSQQGPTLRCEFTFCTGAIADRKFQGKSLALQVVPLETARQLRRENPNVVVFEAGSEQDIPSWLLRLQSEPDLRMAFTQLEIGIQDRELIPLVLDLVNASDDSKERVLITLLQRIASKYPSPIDGKDIKSKLFRKTSFLGKLSVLGVSEQDLLRALCKNAGSSAYDAVSFELRERGHNLWKLDGMAAHKLALDLLHGDGNELGDEVLTGLMDGAPESEALDFVERYSGLVVALVRRNHSLAASPRIWRLPKLQARDVLEAIGHLDSPTKLNTRQVIAAILEAERFELTAELVERYGQEAVSAIVSWVEHQQVEPLPDKWVMLSRMLCKRQHIVLDYVTDNSPGLLAKVFLITGFDQELVEKVPEEFWNQLDNRNLPKLSPVFRTAVNTVLLVVGLRHGASGQEFVTRSFCVVHAALAKDDLEYDYWRLLDGLLPTLGMWRNWDKCERLRQVLADHAIRCDWSVASILSATQDNELFDEFIKTCSRTNSGREFLIRAERESRRSSQTITSHQRRILSERKVPGTR